MLLQQCTILTAHDQAVPFCLYVYFKVLYESTSEESADEDGEQEEEGLLDMEDLGPMMNKIRKTKVKYHCAVI